MAPAFLAKLHAVLLALLAVSALAACSERRDGERGPVVLAASSLQEALEEIGEAWAEQGHAQPVFSFAASSALARQVGQGAPADIFISADEEWMDHLAARGLLRANSRRAVAGNTLVLVGSAGGAVRDLSQLGEERLALADPEAVPAGKYAKAALEHSGQWAGLADNVAAAENVRAALALVERGEAPLGIVYATDALASDRVEVLQEFPAASHPPIRYPAAVLDASRHAEVDRFLAFLAAPEAARILQAHGFSAPE